MRKRIFHLLSAVGLTVLLTAMFSGCTEELATEMTKNRIMLTADDSGFDNEHSVTRGSKVTSISSFGVSASVYNAASTYTTAGCGSYFYKEAVTNGTPMSYYWPTSDYRLSFFAYYPRDNAAFTMQSSAATAGAPTYHYTVPSAIASQVDVMTGQNVDVLGGGTSAVGITMKHRCAAVSFSVTNSRSSAITLSSVSIEGVKYDGTLCEDTWTLSSAVNSSSANPFSLSYGSSIAASATANITGTSNIFLMLPQAIPAGAKVKVVVDGEDPMYADLTGSWVAGRHYSYSLEVKNNTIVVVANNSDIEAWSDYEPPLTFIAEEEGTFTLTIPVSINTNYVTSVSYSLDNGQTWVLTQNSSSKVTITTPTVAAGSRVLWRGSGIRYGNTTDTSSSVFSSTGRFSVEGNIMSLLYDLAFRGKTTFKANGEQSFAYLFYGCSKLTSAEDLLLPATTAIQNCYSHMFHGCSGLTAAPELPATTLALNCYNNMFYGCSSLTRAPELPATTMANACYSYMFQMCTSLIKAPVLPATTAIQNCYQYMFQGCTSLIKAPELPATTVGEDCYRGMFKGCTALTKAPSILPATQGAVSYCEQMFYGCSNLTTSPELPATTMKGSDYLQMFYNCKSLKTAPSILPATTLNTACYKQMFYGCSSLTTAPNISATVAKGYCCQEMFYNCKSLTTAPAKLPATLAKYCFDNMFYACSSLTRAPELPATTLSARDCYKSMFSGCKKLSYVKAAFKTKPSTTYTSGWLYDVAAKGNFYKNSAATWSVSGISGVPSGWTIYTYTP